MITRFSGLRPVPWRRGGGETVDLASEAGDRDRGWKWRISLATVAASGPFSAFPGLQRILTVVDGGELDLRIGSKAHRARRHEPLAFDGGAQATASLLDSRVRALNVIFNPVAIRAHVEVEQLDGGTSLAADEVAVALGGDLRLGGFGLSRFDTVRSGSPRTVVRGRGVLARITVRPRE